LHLIFSGAETRHRRNREELWVENQRISGKDSRKNLMTISIQPLHDRVIVKRIDEGEQVRGGIFIPDTAKEKPQEGEVIAAGAGKYKEDGSRQALDVKAGDRVLLGKYSGSEVKLGGEELLIIREDEILGIITRAGAAASSGSSGKKSSK
jgi:chaperonin GroES